MNSAYQEQQQRRRQQKIDKWSRGKAETRSIIIIISFVRMRERAYRMADAMRTRNKKQMESKSVFDDYFLESSFRFKNKTTLNALVCVWISSVECLETAAATRWWMCIAQFLYLFMNYTVPSSRHQASTAFLLSYMLSREWEKSPPERKRRRRVRRRKKNKLNIEHIRDRGHSEIDSICSWMVRRLFLNTIWRFGPKNDSINKRIRILISHLTLSLSVSRIAEM